MPFLPGTEFWLGPSWPAMAVAGVPVYVAPHHLDGLRRLEVADVSGPSCPAAQGCGRRPFREMVGGARGHRGRRW